VPGGASGKELLSPHHPWQRTSRTGTRVAEGALRSSVCVVMNNGAKSRTRETINTDGCSALDFWLVSSASGYQRRGMRKSTKWRTLSMCWLGSASQWVVATVLGLGVCSSPRCCRLASRQSARESPQRLVSTLKAIKASGSRTEPLVTLSNSPEHRSNPAHRGRNWTASQSKSATSGFRCRAFRLG
jgi:hypothetical protein